MLFTRVTVMSLMSEEMEEEEGEFLRGEVTPSIGISRGGGRGILPFTEITAVSLMSERAKNRWRRKKMNS